MILFEAIYSKIAAYLAPIFLGFALIFGYGSYHYFNKVSELTTKVNDLEGNNKILEDRLVVTDNSCKEKQDFSRTRNKKLDDDISAIRQVTESIPDENNNENVMRKRLPDEVLKRLDPSYVTD